MSSGLTQLLESLPQPVSPAGQSPFSVCLLFSVVALDYMLSHMVLKFFALKVCPLQPGSKIFMAGGTLHTFHMLFQSMLHTPHSTEMEPDTQEVLK